MEPALLQNLLREVRSALDSEDIAQAKKLLDDLHPADLADAIGDLSL